jgi:predicted membrane chloride channel (bestrophin family)
VKDEESHEFPAIPGDNCAAALGRRLALLLVVGVEVIDSVIDEPFGRQRDDLDLDCYCRTVRDGVRASLPFAAKVG